MLPEPPFLRTVTLFGNPAEHHRSKRMKFTFKLKFRWLGLRLNLSMTR